MGELSCKRAEVMIEDLLDDLLDEPERAIIDVHLLRCPDCQSFRQAAVFTRSALGSQPLAEPPDRAMQRMWQELQSRLDEEPVPPAVKPPRSRRRSAVAGVIGLAVAAGLAALVIGLLAADQPPSTPEPVAAGQEPAAERPEVAVDQPPAPAPLRLAAGQARVDGADASGGVPLSEGDRVTTPAETMASLELGEHLQIALGPDSSVQLLRRDADGIELSLDQGWVVGRLDPTDERLTLKVHTPAGELTVLGTIFAVEATDEEEVEVRVSRGRVAFRVSDGDEPVEIEAGRSGRFPAGATSELDDQASSRDEALLDGRFEPPQGPAPALVFDPDSLFEQAEAARRQGQHSRAAALYQQITASNGSGSAGTAQISLGQLYLGPLGQPARARGVFARYLSSNRRGLRQEAFIGLFRAQRALGQAAAAAATARRYLTEYPDGRYRQVVER